MRGASRTFSRKLEMSSESGVGTEARVVDLAHPKDCGAEPDDAASADCAAESPGITPLAQSRGLDLSDDIGAIDPICRQIDAFCRKMAKHGMAAFVDGGNVAQVKPDWFTLRKRLNATGLDRRDALAGQRAIHRDGCARQFVCCHNPYHRRLPLRCLNCRLRTKLDERISYHELDQSSLRRFCREVGRHTYEAQLI